VKSGYYTTLKYGIQLVRDHYDMLNEFYADMSNWIGEGKIKWRETVFEGIENARSQRYTEVLFADRTNCTHQALGRRPTLAHSGFIFDWSSYLLVYQKKFSLENNQMMTIR